MFEPRTRHLSILKNMSLFGTKHGSLRRLVDAEQYLKSGDYYGLRVQANNIIADYSSSITGGHQVSLHTLINLYSQNMLKLFSMLLILCFLYLFYWQTRCLVLNFVYLGYCCNNKSISTLIKL